MSIRDWFIEPRPPDPHDEPAGYAPPEIARGDRGGDSPPGRGLSGAAVVGRAGEAEPVAAGIGLALRRVVGVRAVAVVVVGEGEPAVAGLGTGSARRLAARLAAHGFEAAERGRLVWTRVAVGEAQRAALVGAPAVLAVTVPLTPALERAIAEQDLAVVVTPDDDGPLACLAVASLARAGPRVVTTRPLARGLARALARAGVAAPRSARALVAR